MNQSDEVKFAEIMMTIGEVFSKPLTNTQMDIYFDCLKEYSIDDVSLAAKNIIRNRTITGTFPLISEFVQAIGNKNGTVEERAELAWAKLIWTIEHVGHMQSIQFDDPIIHDTVQSLGGWLRVCSADGDIYNEDWHTKNLQWRRKDFISMYKNYAGRASTVQYLPGLQELENQGKYPEYMPTVRKITGKPGVFRISYVKVDSLPEPDSSGSHRKELQEITEKVLH